MKPNHRSRPSKPTSSKPGTASRSSGPRSSARSEAGCLGLVATPIGNLGDLSPRALDWLRSADLIACEDSRVTGKLLTHFGIDRPLVTYHDHNAARMRPKLLEHLQRGEKVALVSDAGTPLISDPGYKLVAEAREAGVKVTVLPGASAPIAALLLSGLPTDRFMFAGFLPNKSAARRKAALELARVPATLIFFETAPRLSESLEDLAAVLGDRRGAVVREITKLFEETRQDRLSALAAHYREAGPPKGEIVVVVGPPEEDTQAEFDLDQELRAALAYASLKDAVAEIALKSGLPRKQVYARALALQDEDRAR